MSHDQNFKNLILDYPREALAFFAESEAAAIDESARIVPIRQEQLQERLGERFRELDVPLLVEWPDGRRETLLFVLEEESEAGRFSIHRLAHYCLDLAEMFETNRVVPVVIFLRTARGARAQLLLGGDRHTYLRFHYLSCALGDLEFEAYRNSENLVARLNLPNMRYPKDRKVAAYASAVRGLTQLERDPEKQLKYLDFIDIYTGLDDNERRQYEREYPEEVLTMNRFAERFRQEGLQQGIEQGLEQGLERGLEQGLQKGEARILARQLKLKFGELPEALLRRIEQADEQTLLLWSERVLSAERLEEVFGA